MVRNGKTVTTSEDESDLCGSHGRGSPGYHWMHFTAAGEVMLKFLKAAKEIGSRVP